MDKVFVLTQSSYHEGNFGDLEYEGETIIGIYSSLELAEQAKSSLKIETFNAQFGSGDSTATITEHILDSNLKPEGISNTSYSDMMELNHSDEEPIEEYNGDESDKFLQ